MRGSESVDIIIRVGMKGVGFVLSNCHFILMLLVEGNRVKDVE